MMTVGLKYFNLAKNTKIIQETKWLFTMAHPIPKQGKVAL